MAALCLGGCVNNIALDELSDTPPSGTPFDQALYLDYAFLAKSFGNVGMAGYKSFDRSASLSVDNTDNDVARLAETFAQKAQALTKGLEVDPLPGVDNNSHDLRDRLVRALDKGRTDYPRDAARAQADYDCWMLNSTVASQAGAAAACRRSLSVTLPRLEAEVQSGPAEPAAASGGTATPQTSQAQMPAAPTPDAQASAASAPAAQASAPQASASVAKASYTVTFDFDSWHLDAAAMGVLQKAIAEARAGGEPKIAVVGHSDTVGSADYNMQLSLKRAEAVRDALVAMGARRDAIDIKAVGKADLAVETGDNVRERKNRRSVITLEI